MNRIAAMFFTVEYRFYGFIYYFMGKAFRGLTGNTVAALC